MPTLYYKSPTDGSWVPFGTTDPVADEVVIATTAPPDPLVDVWIDPSGTGTALDWDAFDARYIGKSDVADAVMASPLTLPGDPTANLQAATKQYVDTAVTIVANETLKAHMPVGSVTLFFGTYVPPGWHFCDGTEHNSWSLLNVLGSPTTPVLTAPDGMSYIIYGGA